VKQKQKKNIEKTCFVKFKLLVDDVSFTNQFFFSCCYFFCYLGFETSLENNVGVWQVDKG